MAILLLALHLSLLTWSASQHSPSLNEPAHLAAGLSHWKLGQFDMYRVNPPLVRMAAAIPAAVGAPPMPWSRYPITFGTRAELTAGEEFIDVNGERSIWFLTLGRWACLPFSLLGGYICYRWSSELYGATAALLPLALWCFDPNVLAHGQMITADMGATALCVSACYLFWRWLREPRWARSFTAGLVIGAAELTKTTLLVLYVALPAAWLVQLLTERIARRHNLPRQAGRSWMCQAAQLATMLAVSVYIINVGYGFERSFEQLGRLEFLSRMFCGPRTLLLPSVGNRNRFVGTTLASVRIPLPANYVLGIDQQKYDFERGYPSYFHGHWHDSGRWYYYLYAMALKIPIATLAIICCGLLRWAAGARAATVPHCATSQPASAHRLAATALFLPAAAIIALVSSQTGINSHFRYLLPLLPFLLIAGGRIALPPTGLMVAPACFRAAAPWLVGAAASWSTLSSLSCYPHSLSYFNELAGGPLGGQRYLLDSSIDWGQDLLYLRRWLRANTQARPLDLAYYGILDPRVVGIEFALPPRGPARYALEQIRGVDNRSLELERGPLPGWYAISVMLLHGAKFPVHSGDGGLFPAHGPQFTYFQSFEPVAMAGYSIYIYHIDLAQANRVRGALGLPLLSVQPYAHEFDAVPAPLSFDTKEGSHD